MFATWVTSINFYDMNTCNTQIKVNILITTLIILVLQGCMQKTSNGGHTVKRIGISNESVLYPEAGFTKGVSGAFGGALDDWIIYGGGCNFPDAGPLDGGKKKFYHSVYALRESESGVWETKRIGALVEAIAYGTSIPSAGGDSLYFVGGTNGTAALPTILILTLDSSDKPNISPMSFTLPHGWFEGSGAHYLDSLYLCGGWRSPGEAMDSVLRVNLSNGESTYISPLPDGARIQPVSFVCNGYLYLFGGFRPSGEGIPPYMHQKGYRLSLSQPNNGWEEIANTPTLEVDGRKLLFVGSSVAYEPQTHKVYVAGGVDWDIFEEAIIRSYDQSIAMKNGDEVALQRFNTAHRHYMTMKPEAYHFMPHIITYTPETGLWTVVATNPAFATAGTALIARPNDLYIIGGERKPGVRTFDGWKVTHK